MRALIAYYAVVIVVVGPMCLAQAGADPGARVPVRIALNVALHTKKTNVATFTTPFPITVGVASDGSFTVGRGDLAFALVDVPIATSNPVGLGWFTVRAVATSDFLGTVNSTTGAATLDGSLELLWSTRAPAPGQSPAKQPMVQCPVGPFALHLSTATLGGALLAPQSLRDPASRTARLVDDNLDVPAVPGGMKQCAGNQGSLNLALSLPILPAPVPTTTTLAGSSTTSTTDTTTTTTTTTTTPPTTAATSTSTTVGGAPPGPPTDSLGVALDPKVIALEPSPSIVATLTIAGVPPPVGPPTLAGTAGLFVAPPAPPTVAGAPPNPTSPPPPRTVKSAPGAAGGAPPEPARADGRGDSDRCGPERHATPLLLAHELCPADRTAQLAARARTAPRPG